VKTYSLDLRQRVAADRDAGLGTKAVAEKYSVSQSWVRRLMQRRRETGSLDPLPPSPGRPAKIAPHEALVRELVAARPDATLEELLARLPVQASASALCRLLQRLELSFKKSDQGGRAAARGRQAGARAVGGQDSGLGD
jgi:transposase